ncbi:MAG: hypothetical protein WBQ52_10130, partial [Terracidiphilus sp.]
EKGGFADALDTSGLSFSVSVPSSLAKIWFGEPRLGRLPLDVRITVWPLFQFHTIAPKWTLCPFAGPEHGPLPCSDVRIFEVHRVEKE